MASQTPVLNLSSTEQQLQISLYNVDQSEYPSLSLKDVSFSHWIISHVLEGEVETSTNGETELVKSGYIMIHPPHVPFTEIAAIKGVHQWMSFDVYMEPHLEIFRYFPISFVVPLVSPLLYSQLFTCLRASWTDMKSPVRDITTSSYALALISLALENWKNNGSVHRTTTTGTNQDRFHTIIHYMTEHLHRKITRDELAGIFHLHPVYLDRLFTDYYGIPPMKMLRDMRLRRAKKLLESTADNLTIIAEACGFNDTAYFSHQFTKHFTQTPGEYRKQAREVMKSYIQDYS
jgi:AraC-like DNA-binding protein